mmetsp:Transcript_60033/g.131530  ORF Transcript_60033/g.131530 Transcript_60033/m.131530 type:complete len:291 (+) Transcript_60033:103-975(+)
MAAASMHLPTWVQKEVTVVHGTSSCKLMLFEGGDSAALNYAVNARLGLRGAAFYLTVPNDDVAVVPLCTALPSGLTLHLHLCETSHSATSRGAIAAAVPSQHSQVDMRGRSGAAHAFDISSHSHGTGGAVASTGPKHPANPNPAEFEVERDSFVVGFRQGQEEAAGPLGAAAKSIDRFSRLSTDLANERTLLAWLRTVMAAIRTAFSYIGLEALGPLWESTLWISRLSMVTVVLVGTLTGVLRYRKIKAATFMPEPPTNFGRISVYYFFYLVAASVAAMLLGCYADAWDK